MELRQLRAFLQVAGAKHFGRAATTLRITQPALTQRIQALERELGVQLLTRNSREVRLTPAGEVLLPYASRLVHIEDRALRDLADNTAGRAGTLRVAYLLYGDVGTQGRIVAEFRRRYPEVVVETTVAATNANLDLLLAGEVDAAFMGTLQIPADVAVQSIGRKPMMLALPSNHKLAQQSPVPVSSLRGVPIILWPYAWNPEFYTTVTQWLARHTGEEPNIVANEPADQAFEAIAESGKAVTFASAWRAASVEVPGVVFRHMDPEPFLNHQVAYMRDDPSPLLQHLLRITEEVTAAAVGPETRNGELL